jgi:hypothetical protein
MERTYFVVNKELLGQIRFAEIERHVVDIGRYWEDAWLEKIAGVESTRISTLN